MDTILIAGADSVGGAALAATLNGRDRVILVTDRRTPGSALAGGEVLSDAAHDPRGVRRAFAAVRPQWTVYCGPAAESCWDNAPRLPLDERAIGAARAWAAAAHEAGCAFACVSSDAVFTGPWMFHRETCRSICDSPQARMLRAIEAAVLEEHPRALLARTHVFGWSPACSGDGWIERLLTALEDGTAGPLDAIPHATPLLASDFAAVLHQAWQAGLGGVFHIGGAERTSPLRFAQCLAQEFDLPAPACGPSASLLDRPAGFGRGETSLRTTKIRQALGIGLPMLAESLRRLREQRPAALPGEPTLAKAA